MMQEKAKDIVAVLMNEGQLSLAGLGTFSLVAQPASINMIEGQAKPPGKKAAFNPNLRLDDGRLLRYWIQQKGLKQEEAQRQLDEMLSYLLTTLDNNRAVQIPGLGRLFKDHKEEISFTPSDRNLSVDSFGLAAVPISAVVRTDRPASYPTTAPTASRHAAGAPKLATSSRTNQPLAALWLWVSTYIWHIAAATALLFLLGLLYINSRNKQEPIAEAPPSRVEQPISAPKPRVPATTTTPSIQEEDNYADPPQEDYSPNSPSNDTYSNEQQEEYPPSTAPSQPLPSKPNSAIIAVGRYGKEANVNKMVRRIEAAGYMAYTKNENGLTRVGVKYHYKSERDLDEALTDVRRRFSQDAFILSRHKSD